MPGYYEDIMIFKNTLSPTAMFTFDNSVRKAINWCYTTVDKDEIKFLKDNPAWDEVKQDKPLTEVYKEEDATEKEITKPAGKVEV